MQSGPIIVFLPILIVRVRAVIDVPFNPTPSSRIILASGLNVRRRTGCANADEAQRHEDDTNFTPFPISTPAPGDRIITRP
jgi:hypothetical protein